MASDTKQKLDQAIYSAARFRDLHPDEVPGIIDQALEVRAYLDSLGIPHFETLVLRVHCLATRAERKDK